MNTSQATREHLAENRQELLALLLKKKGIQPLKTADIRPRSGSGPSPLSFAQQRLWFLDQLDPGSAVYNIPAAIRLEGPLTISVLERCLQEVVSRHESLRTIFVARNGQASQIVTGIEEFKLEIIDLSGTPRAVREERAKELVSGEAQRAFNLAAGPLFRALLLRMDREDHVLVITMHHIVSDGRSKMILIEELASLYKAFSNNLPSALQPLSIQYADYACWQREHFEKESLDAQLSYWKERLSGELPVLELPADHPRPALQTFRGARQSFTIPAQLSKALKEIGRREGASLFMVLVAAFNTLLHRYTGKDDLTIGTPVDSRGRAELRNLIGLFVNTLVLRTDLSGNPTFRELLQRVRQVALEAYAHQDAPFERLVEELQPERSLSHAPLFQVMLVLQNASSDEIDLSGLRMSALKAESGTAKFDLILDLVETEKELIGVCEYSAELFEASTIDRLLEHLRVILEGVTADPDRRISDLALLHEHERYQVLSAWNDTQIEYPSKRCIHELFEQVVELAPDQIAVIYEGKRVTYDELNRRANQLANCLIELGVRPDELIGILMERSVEMVVSLLAVLKAGGAYVPMDPAYPRERLAHMTENSRVKVLICQERLGNLVEVQGGRIVWIDRDSAEIDGFSQENPATRLGEENLAYVIYTSGSTGKPKGAMNRHGSIANRLLWMQHQYQLHCDDRVLQKTPFSFDVSVWEFFWPLLTGATLVVAKPGGHQDSEYLLNLIEREQITTVHFVPSMLQVFLEEQNLRRSGSLRQVMCSGEALSKELAERFHQRIDAKVHNLYGPTEAAVDVTFCECTPELIERGVPIGRPIANTQIYILDRNLQPMPVGLAGELYIGGANLARGYFDRPELTAETFIANPFGNAGERLYRTGDLAKFREDGNIDYCGRIDHQVKIRGFRIELGEIEAALEEQRGVREAIVIAREDKFGDKRLVGYVVPIEDSEVDSKHLRKKLQEKLPEYMIPSTIVIVQAIPLSPNGKADRRLLPAPDEAANEHEYVAPRTSAEQIIAGVWEEVLAIERPSVEQNFFEIGGHSLLGAQIISRLRASFRIDIPLKALFESPTIAGLAERVEALQMVNVPPIERMPRDAPAPLSFGQQRLWLLNQLNPQSPFYNMPIVFSLTGHLDPDVLSRCLTEVVRRHEVMRTVFPLVDGEPVQIVKEPGFVDLSTIDLSEVPQSQREEYALAKAVELSREPFDLARGPLFRVALLKLTQDRHLVVATMHHIVSDGWSMGLLLEEVAALYEPFASGQPSPLAELPVQYGDFAQWQRRWLRADRVNEQLAYWRRQLGGTLPVLKLPTDRPRPEEPTFRGARHSWTVPAELSRQLKALALRESSTLFMTLLAAFQTLLHRYSGQDEILVGTPIANRPRVEAERLIGCFLNTLVLRTNLAGNPSFVELLAQVRETTIEAYSNQDVPYEQVVEVLQPNRAAGHASLFQVTFALHNNPAARLQHSGRLALSAVEIDNQTAQFDLLLLMAENEENLAASFMYSTDLFDEQTIARMKDHFQTLLGSIAACPESRIDSLEIFSEEEKRRSTMRETQREGVNRKRFLSVKPKAINLSSRTLVRTDEIAPGEPLPLVVQPEVRDVDLADWATKNRDFVESELRSRGGLLFRGFNTRSVADFESFTKALFSQMLEYHERSTPRTEVSKNIYTSTEYPPEQSIALHNEFSYARSWPMRISFFCVEAPSQGGQTPIADSRKVYRLIDPEIRDRFIGKQVQYVRNYGSTIDLPWQTVFQTSDKQEVEDYCRKAPIECEWQDGDRLRTRQVRRATAVHPVTGEVVWFNQAHLFHISNLEADIRRSLVETFADGDLPRNAYYGDGTVIGDQELEEIREAYRKASVIFAWREGDLLLLDNMLVAHGRFPYQGPRRILTAMGDRSENN